jgi:uncharacterized membrane protein
MASESTQSVRRIGILVNYMAIVGVGVLFYFGKYHGWSLPIAAGLLACVAVVAVGFLFLHARTRRWHFTHKNMEELDEREAQVVLESLRHAYEIFTVTCIVLLFGLGLMAGRNDSMLTLICVCMIYLAHTLPSSVIAWTSRRV